MLNICERLHMLRTANNLSQQEVADKIGVSRQAYSYWENGKREMAASTCVKLAKLYGVTCDFLLAGESYLEQEPRFIVSINQKDALIDEMHDVMASALKKIKEVHHAERRSPRG